MSISALLKMRELIYSALVITKNLLLWLLVSVIVRTYRALVSRALVTRVVNRTVTSFALSLSL